DRFNLDMITPGDVVRRMSVAQMQMVEICKALSRNSNILVFDEPTASLAETEIEKLFEIIHELKAQGKGIIYISHRMEELSKIADRVTVLRDGAQIGESFDFNSVSLDEIINRMVGRPLKNKYPQHERKAGDVFFEVDNLRNDKCNIEHLYLRKGEILGVAGLMGAGRTEMARGIVGADPVKSISVKLDGKPVRMKSPEHAMMNGIAYLTEDRKHEGLALGMDCEKNINMSSMKKISKWGFISNHLADQNAWDYVRALSIRTPKLGQLARLLSGGNQQKLVIAKWLSHSARVMIFDEPTRGIDVGAKFEIYKLMNQLSDDGVGIIMISSELPELLGMSDRILLMHEGQVVGELDSKETNQEEVLTYIAGLRVNG
ncbi:MAG: sugar ABC transporter ATP-binding protein, partial [Clostridia bacterium]